MKARISDCPTHFSEPGAATAEAPPIAGTSLTTLLTRHILRDGELVVLILKPSILFILLSSIRFIAAVLILMMAARLFEERLQVGRFLVLQVGVLLIAGRLMWAVLQWTSRLYVLTDLRIVRIAGIFNVNIFDCPLRKIARTRLVHSTRERLLGLGSIEIIPLEEELPIGVWQTIARPRQVQDLIDATIRRARQGAPGLNGR